MSDRNLRLRDIAFRFVVGAPLSGKRRTNAGYFRPGDMALGADRPMRWSFLPNIAKAAIRIITFAYVCLLVWAWWHEPWIDWVTFAVICACCVSAIYLYVYEARKQTAAVRMPWKVSFKTALPYLDEHANESRLVVGFAAGMRPVMLDFDADAPHAIAAMGTGGGKSTFLRGVVAQLLHNGTQHVTIIDPKLISLVEFQDHPQVKICITYPEMWAGIEDFYNVMRDRYQQLHADPTLTFPRRVLIIEEGNSFGSEIRLYWNNELGGKGPAPIIQLLALILFQARQAGMNVIGAYQRLSVAAVGTPDARDQFGFIVMSRFKPSAWKSLVGTSPIPHSPRWRGRALTIVGDETETVQMIGWSQAEALKYAQPPADPDAAFDAAFDAAASRKLEKAQRSDLGKCTRSASRSFGDAAASVQVTADVPNVLAIQAELYRDAASCTDAGGPMQELDLLGDDVTGPDSQVDNTTPPPALPDGYGVTLQEAVSLGIVTCKVGAMRSARQRVRETGRGSFPAPIDKRAGSEVFAVRDIITWEQNRPRGASDDD